MKKAAFLFLALLLYAPCSLSLDDVWQPTNGPYGGSVNSIVVDSSDNLFAATQHNTVLRSTDNGNTWNETNLPEALQVAALVVPSASRILAGTSNAGVYRTTNQGETWSPSGLGGISVASLTLGSAGLVFAGTDYNGVYRSTDYGNTWTYRGLSGYLIFSLVVNSAGNIFAGVNGSALFLSTDQGLTWTRKANGFYDGTDVTALAVQNDSLYAGTHTFGLWRSTNEGDLWTRLGSISSDIRAIAFDGVGSIFLGDAGGITKSTDRGITWLAVDSVYRNVQVNSIALNSKDHITIGGKWRGFSQSTDGGGSWTRRSSGFRNADVLSLATNGHTVYAGVTWDGVYATSDNGMSWQQVWFSTNMVLGLLANDGDIIAAPTNGQYGIYHSTNGGTDWTQTNMYHGVFRQIVIAPDAYVYAGKLGGVELGVYVSTDNGASWSSTGLMDRSIYSLAVTPLSHVFAGTAIDGIFRSTDSGQTWTQVASFNATIVALAVNQDGYVFAAADKIYKSTDNGATWDSTGQGFGDTVITTLAVDSDNSLIAGTGSGVFSSSDRGNTWTNISNGMQRLDVQSLLACPNGSLFAGMYQGSAYRTIDSTTSVGSASSGLPGGWHLFQNYPNPFNPTTTINFSLPRSGDVSLKIFNLLGEEVTTLVSGNRSAGTHKVQWDATAQPSGLYFYRLRAGEFVETRKLVLVR